MRKIVSPVALSLLLFALVFDARLLASTRPRSLAAQGHAATRPQASWKTYTSKGEEFSVMLPEMPVLDHTTRDIEGLPGQRRTLRDYAAYSDGVVYVIRAYDKPREGEDLDYFFKDFVGRLLSASDIVKVERQMTLGKFPGRQYVITRDSSRIIPLSSIYVFLTKQHAYAVRAAGGDDSHPDVRRFIDSFKLANKPAGQQVVDEIPRLPSAARDASAAPSSPDNKTLRSGDPKSNGIASKTNGDVSGVGKGENPGIGSGTGVGSGMGVGAGSGNGIGSGTGGGIGQGEPVSGVVDYSKTFPARDVTRKAQIIHKPEPYYTEAARRNQVTGTVRLRLTLSASGQVTGITPVSRLPDGLTEMAIRAAIHIKFIPAIKDGHRVSQYVTIEYNFNIY